MSWSVPLSRDWRQLLPQVDLNLLRRPCRDLTTRLTPTRGPTHCSLRSSVYRQCKIYRFLAVLMLPWNLLVQWFCFIDVTLNFQCVLTRVGQIQIYTLSHTLKARERPFAAGTDDASWWNFSLILISNGGFQLWRITDKRDETVLTLVVRSTAPKRYCRFPVAFDSEQCTAVSMTWIRNCRQRGRLFSFILADLPAVCVGQ